MVNFELIALETKELTCKLLIRNEVLKINQIYPDDYKIVVLFSKYKIIVHGKTMQTKVFDFNSIFDVYMWILYFHYGMLYPNELNSKGFRFFLLNYLSDSDKAFISKERVDSLLNKINQIDFQKMVTK